MSCMMLESLESWRLTVARRVRDAKIAAMMPKVRLMELSVDSDRA